MSSDHLERLARDLFEAYGGSDLETMRSLLAEDLTAYITNADAGVDRVEGRDNFLSRLPDLVGAELSTAITQIVGIDEERVMTMIEIEAERQGRTLHTSPPSWSEQAEARLSSSGWSTRSPPTATSSGPDLAVRA